MFLSLAAAHAWAAHPCGDWWNSHWPYRQVVRIGSPDPTNTINTALAVLDTDGKCLKDGRDFRVLDAEARLLKHKLLSQKDDIVRIEFQVPDASARRYFIYYGNPKAQPVSHTWTRKLGGLRLQTWSNTMKRNAHSWAHFKKLLRASKWKHNEGPRKRIDDSENPFGPDDQYLSVYSGRIFCPVDGAYAFATNSDDSSFLSINGQLVAEWPGGHNPVVHWDEAAAGRVSREIKLKRGIHKIEYHHVETRGGQLARAGWKPPGHKAFATIPEEAFIRELRTQIVARQARQKPLNAYFEAREIDAVQFGNLARVFPTVRFQCRTHSAFGVLKIFAWDFGDRGTSREKDPVHPYTKAGAYRVRLTVWDRLGFKDTCVRTIKVGTSEPRRVTLFMDVEEEASVLMPRQKTHLRIRLQNTGIEKLPVALVCKFAAESPQQDLEPILLLHEVEALELVPKQWLKRTRELPDTLDNGLITLQVTYRGVPVRERSLRVVPADGRAGRLAARNNGFEDDQGRRVILRLRPYASVPPANTFEDLLKQGASVRVVVVDDSLSDPTPGKESQIYYELFRQRLIKKYPDANVSVHRIGMEALSGYPPLARLAEAPSLVAEAKPNLVILAGSMNDVLNCLPVDQYERNLLALLDRIRGASSAQILLVASPPIITNPSLSKDYAEATKRAALLRNVPVADAYSAFALLGDRWKELYRDPDASDPVYYLAPTPAGQELIAKAIYNRLLGRTWWLKRERR